MASTFPDISNLDPDDFRLRITPGDPEYVRMKDRVWAYVVNEILRNNEPTRKHCVEEGVDAAMRELCTSKGHLPKKLFEHYWRRRAVWRYRDCVKDAVLEGVDVALLPSDKTTFKSMACLQGVTGDFLSATIGEWKHQVEDEIKAKLYEADNEKTRKFLENKLFIALNIESLSEASLEEIRKMLPNDVSEERISQMRLPLRDWLRVHLLLHQPLRVLCILELPPCPEDSKARATAGVTVAATLEGENCNLSGEGCVRISKYFGKPVECADSKGIRFVSRPDTILFSVQHEQLPPGRPHGMRLEWRAENEAPRVTEHDGRKGTKIDGTVDDKVDWGMPLHVIILPACKTEGSEIQFEYRGEGGLKRKSGEAIDFNMTIRL